MRALLHSPQIPAMGVSVAGKGIRARSAAAFRPSASASPASTKELYQTLAENLADYKAAPPSMVGGWVAAAHHMCLLTTRTHRGPTPVRLQKMEVGVDVMQTFQKLTDAGALQKWGKAAQEIPGRRNVMMGARAGRQVEEQARPCSSLPRGPACPTC